MSQRFYSAGLNLCLHACVTASSLIQVWVCANSQTCWRIDIWAAMNKQWVQFRFRYMSYRRNHKHSSRCLHLYGVYLHTQQTLLFFRLIVQYAKTFMYISFLSSASLVSLLVPYSYYCPAIFPTITVMFCMWLSHIVKLDLCVQGLDTQSVCYFHISIPSIFNISP